MGHRLTDRSATAFEGRPEYADLDNASSAVLLIAAAVASSEHHEGHLLLREWQKVVREFESARLVDMEDAVMGHLSAAGGLDAAIRMLREPEVVARVRPELERVRDELEDVANEEREAANAVRRAGLERLEKYNAERVARRAASMEAAAQRAREKQIATLPADAETLERSRRAQADRRKPPVHDFTYEPSPWEC